MITNLIALVFTTLLLSSASCSPRAQNPERDPSRTCVAEMAPDGNRADALERLLRGDHEDNACHKELRLHGGKFQ